MSRVVSADRPVPLRRPMSPLWRIVLGLLPHVPLAAGAAAMTIPFFFLISGSLNTPVGMFAFPPILVPNPLHPENYPYVLFERPYLRYLQNTMTVLVPSVLGQLFSSILAAYAFARMRFRGRDLVFGITLATIMLPYAVTMIPTYVMFNQVGMVGTFWPLILPFWFGGSAFYTFLLRQFFRTIPLELEEAAIIDGAGYLTIIRQIILPLSVPAIVVITILSVLSHYTDYLGPLIYAKGYEMWTLAIGIVMVKGAFATGGMARWNLVMAMSALMVIPVIAIFFLAQRVFIQGIVLTGIKG